MCCSCFCDISADCRVENTRCSCSAPAQNSKPKTRRFYLLRFQTPFKPGGGWARQGSNIRFSLTRSGGFITPTRCALPCGRHGSRKCGGNMRGCWRRDMSGGAFRAIPVSSVVTLSLIRRGYCGLSIPAKTPPIALRQNDCSMSLDALSIQTNDSVSFFTALVRI